MDSQLEMQQYYLQLEKEYRQEFLYHDPVYLECGYVTFVSRSKGRNKKGKKILRRHWKEVELFRRSRGWHLPQNFQFDCEATELLGRGTGPEELMNQMRKLCSKKGGKGKTDYWTLRNSIIRGMNKVKGYRFQLI